jgi:hypothetical protein
MDKKILLGGAAALLLVGNMYATPASASIDLSIGGEAKLTASMSDKCFDDAAAVALNDVLEADGMTVATAGSGLHAELNTYINTQRGTSGIAYLAVPSTDVATGDAAQSVTFDVDPCGSTTGAIKEDNPVLGFSKEITIDASGTLANGLEVSFSDKIDLTSVSAEEKSFDLTFGGAFGSLQFKKGAPGAVDAAMVGGNGDVDITGNKVGTGVRGRHPSETAGTDGIGILYQAPSMGTLDIYFGYAPNSADTGLDTSPYLDTFSIGAVFNADAITVGAGFESASANGTHGACTATGAGDLDGLSAANLDAQALYNIVYGGDFCGDQSLMYIGAEMEAAGLTLAGGYSKLDTDEADLTVMNIGMSTDLGEYDVSIDYRNNKKDYLGTVDDTQTVIGAAIGTSLGDGVDLDLQFSTNQVDLASQKSGNGKTNNYFAEVAVTVGF